VLLDRGRKAYNGVARIETLQDLSALSAMITQRITLSPEPVVILENAFSGSLQQRGGDRAHLLLLPSGPSGEVAKDEPTRERRDVIAQSILQSRPSYDHPACDLSVCPG